MNSSTKERLRSIPPAVWMMLVLIIFFGSQVKNYFSVSNFVNILIQSMPLLIVACGQTLVVLIQGTDLSLGASVSMVTILWMVFLQKNIPMAIAILLAIACAVVGGILNGIIIAKGHLPPFIATLGMQNIMASIALVLSNGSSIYFDHPIYKIIGSGTFLFIPVSVCIGLLCFIGTWVLQKKTRTGAKIIALGGNQEAVSLSGASVIKNTIFVFAFAGLMAGIAGIVLGSRIQSGNPIAGNGFEFNSVAAVLLGGTSMREGRGSVAGTIFGVLLIQILKSGLNQMAVSSIYQSALIGGVVLAAIILDAYMKRRQEI